MRIFYIYRLIYPLYNGLCPLAPLELELAVYEHRKKFKELFWNSWAEVVEPEIGLGNIRYLGIIMGANGEWGGAEWGEGIM